MHNNMGDDNAERLQGLQEEMQYVLNGLRLSQIGPIPDHRRRVLELNPPVLLLSDRVRYVYEHIFE